MTQILIDMSWMAAASCIMASVVMYALSNMTHTFGLSLHSEHHQPTERPLKRNHRIAAVIAMPPRLCLMCDIGMSVVPLRSIILHRH